MSPQNLLKNSAQLLINFAKAILLMTWGAKPVEALGYGRQVVTYSKEGKSLIFWSSELFHVARKKQGKDVASGGHLL